MEDLWPRKKSIGFYQYQLLLVATKIDSLRRSIDAATALKFADRNKMTYVETSAKENIHITELFENCIQFYIETRFATQDTSYTPDQENQSKCNIL